MGAFEDEAKRILKGCLGAIAGRMQFELDGTPNPWREVKVGVDTRPRYEVLEDFVYEHRDQDVNHGTYFFKKGQIVGRMDQRFMTDRSKLRFIGFEDIDIMEWKGKGE